MATRGDDRPRGRPGGDSEGRCRLASGGFSCRLPGMLASGTELSSKAETEVWPPLPLEEWKATRDTLHMWSQIVGKLRLALAPPVNHWWHVPLYLTSRGLSTAPLAVRDHHPFSVDFDFCAHELVLSCLDGRRVTLPLRPYTVAEFYRRVLEMLDQLGVRARIWPMPVEVPDPIPFAEDHHHASYDPLMAERFWRTLLRAGRVLEHYRSGFLGKCSPVHFFWGGFDLAVTRFSGRRAPEHPPIPGVPDFIVQEAYSHEVASVGFWPGDDRFPSAAFYGYAYPEPPGFREAIVGPEGAYYNHSLGEFILPYERVRFSPDPERAIRTFIHDLYQAAADLGGWDRDALEPSTQPTAPMAP